MYQTERPRPALGCVLSLGVSRVTACSSYFRPSRSPELRAGVEGYGAPKCGSRADEDAGSAIPGRSCVRKSGTDVARILRKWLERDKSLRVWTRVQVGGKVRERNASLQRCNLPYRILSLNCTCSECGADSLTNVAGAGPYKRQEQPLTRLCELWKLPGYLGTLPTWYFSNLP